MFAYGKELSLLSGVCSCECSFVYRIIISEFCRIGKREMEDWLEDFVKNLKFVGGFVYVGEPLG